MNKSRSAFITFFPIKPDTMGSSAVVNSRFDAWPYPKKIFQISHVQKINSKKIETIFIKRERPLYKILSLPKMIVKVYKYIKGSKKKIIIIEGASWIFYSFTIILFFKLFTSKVKIIYISHSIESQIRKKYSNVFIFNLTKFLEKLVFKFSDFSTSVSYKEKKSIKYLYKVDPILLPNGINLKKYDKKRKIKNEYIIYTGSYSYKPNKDAIDYLNYYIMPRLTKKFPKLKLVLTGGGLTDSFPWLINKDIVSKKYLNNLIYFSKCMCVPLKFGSGTRIKIIEALSLGAIVISTKKGIEGIRLKSKNPPFIINDNNLFLKKIIEIIKYNKEIKKNSNNAKNFYLKNYSMNNIIKKFVNEVNL